MPNPPTFLSLTRLALIESLNTTSQEMKWVKVPSHVNLDGNEQVAPSPTRAESTTLRSPLPRRSQPMPPQFCSIKQLTEKYCKSTRSTALSLKGSGSPG